MEGPVSVDLEKLKSLHQELLSIGEYPWREDLPAANRFLHALSARITAGRKLRDALQQEFPAIAEELEYLRAYRDQAEAGRETVENLLFTGEQAKAELENLRAEIGRRKRMAQQLASCAIMDSDSGPTRYRDALDELETWIRGRMAL